MIPPRDGRDAVEPSTARLINAMAALDRSPRGEAPPRLPPPLVLGDEVDGIGDLVAAAFEQRVGDRRLGWALLRVAELVLRSLEEQRLLADDRPELALSAWRDWCLGGEPQRLYDAYNQMTEAARAARDRLTNAATSAQEQSHAMFIACAAIEALALAARGVQTRATNEGLVTLAIDAAIFGLDLRETYDVATARVVDEFRFGLTERGP